MTGVHGLWQRMDVHLSPTFTTRGGCYTTRAQCNSQAALSSVVVDEAKVQSHLLSSLLCRERLSLFCAANDLACLRRDWGSSSSVCRPHGRLAASLGLQLSGVAALGPHCGGLPFVARARSDLSPSFHGLFSEPCHGVTLCRARNQLAPSVFCYAHKGWAAISSLVQGSESTVGFIGLVPARVFLAATLQMKRQPEALRP